MVQLMLDECKTCEDDIERKVFHQTLYRQTEQESENFIQLANECLSVLFFAVQKRRKFDPDLNTLKKSLP